MRSPDLQPTESGSVNLEYNTEAYNSNRNSGVSQTFEIKIFGHLDGPNACTPVISTYK